MALLFRLLLPPVSLAFATLGVGAPAELTAEQAAREARILRTALVELHPALTKYRTAAEIETAFRRWDQRAGAARTRGEMFLAASELTAAIQCSHTWPQTRNNQGEAVMNLLNADADKLPCLFTRVEDRWFVTGSAVDDLAVGDEILAVDEVPVAEIVARLMPYLRADGAAPHKRLDQLDHRWDDANMFDFLWPLLQPAADGRRRLRIERAGARRDVAVTGITLAERGERLRARGYREPDRRWRFAADGTIAVLTLPTFAPREGNFDGQAWLRDTFAQLQAKPVRGLVLDLRANEGGADALAEDLLRYLLQEPLVIPPGRPIGAYERVPYVLARFLETWDYGFFDRTGKVEPLGERRYLLKYRMPAERRLEPHPTAFPGRVAVLIGPRNSSASSVLARRLQDTRRAVLVGQPTGGNRRGLNGGEIAWIRLPHSGVAVDIPLVAQNPARDEPDAGTEPDVAVKRTVADLRRGGDPELAAARRLLESP